MRREKKKFSIRALIAIEQATLHSFEFLPIIFPEIYRKYRREVVRYVMTIGVR